MNSHCLQWDGTLLEHLQLSQLALGTVVPLEDPCLPAAASASTCCGTAVPLLWFPLLAVGQRSLCCGFLCLLCVSGPIILRRSLYRATTNYGMGYPLYCENELPVTLLTLKLVLLGEEPSKFLCWRGRPFWWPLLLPPKSKTISTSSSCIELHELTCPIFTCTHTHAERLDGPNVLLVYTGIRASDASPERSHIIVLNV